MKRSPLRRRTALRSRPRRENRNDPARLAWTVGKAGYCTSCTGFSMHLEHHHVVSRQQIGRMDREDVLFDPANGMWICERCHERHTTHFRKLPLPSVPDEALRFAVDLFGSDLLPADWLSRHYQPEVPEGEQHLWRWQP